jgi:hypothetical protein
MEYIYEYFFEIVECLPPPPPQLDPITNIVVINLILFQRW